MQVFKDLISQVFKEVDLKKSSSVNEFYDLLIELCSIAQEKSNTEIGVIKSEDVDNDLLDSIDQSGGIITQVRGFYFYSRW